MGHDFAVGLGSELKSAAEAVALRQENSFYQALLEKMGVDLVALQQDVAELLESGQKGGSPENPRAQIAK